MKVREWLVDSKEAKPIFLKSRQKNEIVQQPRVRKILIFQ